MKKIFVILLILFLSTTFIFYSGCEEKKEDIDDNESLEVFILVNRSSGDPPLKIKFNASVENANVEIISYNWNFGDGNTATGKTVTYTYKKNGTYLVTLTVKDKNGVTTNASKTINVDDESGVITIKDFALQASDLTGNYQMTSENYSIEKSSTPGFGETEKYNASFENNNGGYLSEILYKNSNEAVCSYLFENYIDDYLKTNFSNQSLNLENIGDESYFTMNVTTVGFIDVHIYVYTFRIDEVWVVVTGFDMFDTNYNETLHNYCKKIESKILEQPGYQIDPVSSDEDLVTYSINTLNLKIEDLPSGFTKTEDKFNNTFNETFDYFEHHTVSFLKTINQENNTNLTFMMIKFISIDKAEIFYDTFKAFYDFNQTFTHIENYDNVVSNESILFDIDCANLTSNNENYTFGKLLIARNRNILLMSALGSKNSIYNDTIISYANIVVENIDKSLK